MKLLTESTSSVDKALNGDLIGIFFWFINDEFGLISFDFLLIGGLELVKIELAPSIIEEASV